VDDLANESLSVAQAKHLALDDLTPNKKPRTVNEYDCMIFKTFDDDLQTKPKDKLILTTNHTTSSSNEDDDHMLMFKVFEDEMDSEGAGLPPSCNVSHRTSQQAVSYTILYAGMLWIFFSFLTRAL
jgi:hypothetical protein